MRKINNDLRKLCASLEGLVAARLDGEYERFDALARQVAELLPKVREAEKRFKESEAKYKESGGKQGAALFSNNGNGRNAPLVELRSRHAEMITLENQLTVLEQEQAKLKMLAFDTRLVVLNEIREKVNLWAQPYFDELTAISQFGKKVAADARQAKGISRAPITVTVTNQAELEALLYSPYIRKAETLQALREIVRSYQEYDFGTIVVHIHDNREGVPGIRWSFPDDESEKNTVNGGNHG